MMKRSSLDLMYIINYKQNYKFYWQSLPGGTIAIHTRLVVIINHYNYNYFLEANVANDYFQS